MLLYVLLLPLSMCVCMYWRHVLFSLAVFSSRRLLFSAFYPVTQGQRESHAPFPFSHCTFLLHFIQSTKSLQQHYYSFSLILLLFFVILFVRRPTTVSSNFEDKEANKTLVWATVYWVSWVVQSVPKNVPSKKAIQKACLCLSSSFVVRPIHSQVVLEKKWPSTGRHIIVRGCLISPHALTSLTTSCHKQWLQIPFCAFLSLLRDGGEMHAVRILGEKG